ncbi:MAG: winged helix-turn-helix transcriptional regulator [Clostridia bacterium]|nr:winged helix-turn-helix transcriptional regulator [Clostridia bacterium]
MGEDLCYLPPEETTNELADFFATFADPTRMRILTLLTIGDYCVNDVSDLLGMNQSTISHQLQKLRKKRLIDCHKSGKKTVYFLRNEKINDLFLQAVLATEQ